MENTVPFSLCNLGVLILEHLPYSPAAKTKNMAEYLTEVEKL